MCALNAKETNGACKELFDRLVAKGKNKKLAVIAVANKLLKQVFGVVKTNACSTEIIIKKQSDLFVFMHSSSYVLGAANRDYLVFCFVMSLSDISFNIFATLLPVPCRNENVATTSPSLPRSTT